MKTQIIQIENHDDFVSVRDKMSWAQAARILLIWPYDEPPLLNRELDLKLLQRHARRLGAQLALVTRNPEARYFARHLAIPVYRNSREAQQAHWRIRRRRDKSTPVSLDPPREAAPAFIPLERRPRQAPIPAWQRLFGLTAGLLVVLVFVGVMAPRATIAWSPSRMTQTIEFIASTGPTITTVNPSGGVPAQTLQVTLEGRRTIETTGTLDVPGNTAAGRVVFTNLTENPVTVPEGTTVLSGDSPPLRYQTTQGGTLNGEAGATLELPVEAVEAGPGFNIGPGRITAIQGELGLRLTVGNLESIRGGTSQRLAAATRADQERVHAELLASLTETAKEELAGQLRPGDLLLSETPVLVSTLQENYFPGLDSPSDLLELVLQVEFQVLVLTEVELRNLATVVLDASLPGGYTPESPAVGFRLLESPQVEEDGSAFWQMEAWREVRALTDPARIPAIVVGKSPAAAAQAISASLNLAGDPTIEISPTWWPRMPLLPAQISIRELEG